ncbi:GxxExxY protein [Sphingobacteriaceae bacterium]|nr:GxxExxY protein [Sphingobacteriaceae bacterium]
MKYTEIEYNTLTELAIRSAIEVHKEPGAGLLETVNEHCLIKVLREEGLKVESQLKIPVVFRNHILDKHFMLAILMSEVLVPEIKSFEKILPIHEAQLVTYLKLHAKKPGLLINFNEDLLKNGGSRRINGDLNN